MEITLFGMFMEVKNLFSRYAVVPIILTLFGILNDVSVLPAGYVIRDILALLYKTPFRLL
jgi:hypothetical protein